MVMAQTEYNRLLGVTPKRIAQPITQQVRERKMELRGSAIRASGGFFPSSQSEHLHSRTWFEETAAQGVLLVLSVEAGGRRGRGEAKVLKLRISEISYITGTLLNLLLLLQTRTNLAVSQICSQKELPQFDFLDINT